MHSRACNACCRVSCFLLCIFSRRTASTKPPFATASFCASLLDITTVVLGKLKQLRVNLQLFQTIGKDFTIFDLPSAQGRSFQQERHQGSICWRMPPVSAPQQKEQSLHNFQHSSTQAADGFLSMEVLGLYLLEKYCCKRHTSNIQSYQFHGNCPLSTSDGDPAAYIPYGTTSSFFNPDQTVLLEPEKCERCERCPCFQAFSYTFCQAISRLI